MLFDKKAEATDSVRKEIISPRKPPTYETEIDKKLKRFDDLLQSNWDAYRNDQIARKVYQLRHEKIIKQRYLRKEELEQAEKMKEYWKKRRASGHVSQDKQIKETKMKRRAS